MGIDEVFEKAKKGTLETLKPYFEMARTGGTSAGQFRVKWLRRILICLWLLAAIATIISFCFDIAAYFAGAANPGLSSKQTADPFVSTALGYARSVALVNLVFDLWVAASLWFLARVWYRRECGSRERAKIWKVFLAASIVVGRPSTFLILFLFALIPNGWWFAWPIKYGLMPPFVLITSGVTTLFYIYMSITAFVLMVILIPLKIYQALFNISNHLIISQSQSAVFFGSLVQFWYWFTGTEMPYVEPEPDNSKGARFSTPREVRELRASDGMVFGHVEGAPLWLQNEKHVLIMASTRSGKGVSLIIPHLLRYRGSAFVLDPKGENAKATGRRRAALNDKVFYLDPFGISGKPKARFNPLKRFTPENMEAESKALAAAIVMGEGGKRDHWTASAQQLVAAFILHVVTSPSVLPREKDLGTMRRLLLEKVNGTLEAMSENKEALDGLLRRLAISFLQTPEREFGSILSTAQRETEILDNPFIVASLAASGPGEEVDFAAWHKSTMSVFLCLSAPKFPVFNRWLRLVLTSALDEMTDSLNPPALPVCFMLDELATLGHLQPVENAVGLAAGYGIQLVTVFQDVAQMRDLYKARWASFVGNAGVRAVFALDDYESANYWSQFMGGRLVETRNVQQDNYGMDKSQSKGETMRPLCSPEMLMLTFAKDHMLVLQQGSRPIVSDRVPYFQDKELSGFWDDPRGRQAAQTQAQPSRAAATPSNTPAPPSTPAHFGGMSGRPAPRQANATAKDSQLFILSDPIPSKQEDLDALWEQREKEIQAKRDAFAPQANPSTGETTRHRRVGRNDPCPCGSGKKYKACCEIIKTRPVGRR